MSDRSMVLLSGRDLPYEHDLHLSKLTRTELEQYFKEIGKVQGRIDEKKNLTRIFITLTLEIQSEGNTEERNFIPIPFIVDTGAPVFLILGKGAEDKLKGMGVLANVFSREQGDLKQLKGDLWYKDTLILDPIVNNRTETMEKDDTYNKPQANILGLKALGDLGITICSSEIKNECIKEQQLKQVQELRQCQSEQEHILEDINSLPQGPELLNKIPGSARVHGEIAGSGKDT